MLFLSPGPSLGSCVTPDHRAIPERRSWLRALLHTEWNEGSSKKGLTPGAGKVHDKPGILVSESKDAPQEWWGLVKKDRGASQNGVHWLKRAQLKHRNKYTVTDCNSWS